MLYFETYFLPFYQQIFRYMLIMLVVDRDASPAIGSTDEGGLGLPGLVYLGADHHGHLDSVDIVDMVIYCRYYVDMCRYRYGTCSVMSRHSSLGTS